MENFSRLILEVSTPKYLGNKNSAHKSLYTFTIARGLIVWVQRVTDYDYLDYIEK
jgi:hypothetical protein